MRTRLQERGSADDSNGGLNGNMPRSETAEAYFLSCSLLDNGETLTKGMKKGLGRDAFYEVKNATLYSTMCAMLLAHIPLTLETLVEELKRTGKLNDVGGVPHLLEVTKLAPTTAEADYYIRQLNTYAIRRSVLRTCQQASAKSLDTSIALEDFLPEIEEAFRRATERTPRAGLPGMIGVNERCLGANLPILPAELIDGVLHRGAKLVVGGTSKGRKTWSLLDLGISVATGSDWWGWKTHRGKVVYINFEIMEPFVLRRIESIAKAKGVTLQGDWFRMWTLRGFASGAENLSGRIINALKGEDIALIIVDPVYKMLGSRDENKAGDVASLMNELETISVQLGAAVAIGAHYSKGNQAAKESIDRIGGSGVFARDPDAILTMTGHEEEECLTIETTLRNLPPQDKVVVEWQFPLFVRRTDLDPTALKEQGKKKSSSAEMGRPAKYAMDRISTFVPASYAEGESMLVIRRRAQETCGISRSQFTRIWDDMVDQKWITYNQESGVYRRTSHGDEMSFAYLNTIATFHDSKTPLNGS